MSGLEEGTMRIAARADLDWGPRRPSEHVVIELIPKKQN